MRPLNNPQIDEGRLYSFDALRGVAAIVVVILHSGELYGAPYLAPFGFFAVDLFFLMSGYVIGSVYERKLESGLGARSFMTIRVARLGPAIWLGTAIGLVVYQFYTHGPIPIRLTVMSLLLLPGFGTLIFPLNQPFWSLFYEIYINLAHALSARCLSTTRLIWFVGFTGILYAVAIGLARTTEFGTHPDTLLRGFLRVGWGYGLGLLIYRLRPLYGHRIPKVHIGIPIGLTAYLLASPKILPSVIYSPICLFVGLPVIILLAVTARPPVTLRWLYAFLGTISYPLYAIHYPLLMLGSRLLTIETARTHVAPIVAGVILVATLVEYAYDAPMRAMLRRLSLARSPPEAVGGG